MLSFSQSRSLIDGIRKERSKNVKKNSSVKTAKKIVVPIAAAAFITGAVVFWMAINNDISSKYDTTGLAIGMPGFMGLIFGVFVSTKNPERIEGFEIIKYVDHVLGDSVMSTDTDISMNRIAATNFILHRSEAELQKYNRVLGGPATDKIHTRNGYTYTSNGLQIDTALLDVRRERIISSSTKTRHQRVWDTCFDGQIFVVKLDAVCPIAVYAFPETHVNNFVLNGLNIQLLNDKKLVLCGTNRDLDHLVITPEIQALLVELQNKYNSELHLQVYGGDLCFHIKWNAYEVDEKSGMPIENAFKKYHEQLEMIDQVFQKLNASVKSLKEVLA